MLGPGVNFINIICTNISSYVLALLKNSYEKHARITLMKLTTGRPALCYKNVSDDQKPI